MKYEIGDFDINDLELWEDNPRTISKEELNRLKKSIERKPYFMNARPIVVSDRTGKKVIIAGNQRYKACKELGWTEVPCIVFHCESEEQEVEIAMVDNHNNGEWDVAKLAEKFADYPLGEWLGSDWEKMAGEFDKLNSDDLDEAEPEDPPQESKVKLGEIWKLGNHLLFVGDSTKKETIEKVMGGGMADLIVTDPPYNVAVENSQGMTIMNDNMESGEFAEFLLNSMEAMSSALKPGGTAYVWYGDSEDRAFRNACFNSGLIVKQCLIWVKNTFNLGRQDYQWRHEPCLVCRKNGKKHYFIDDRTQSTVIEQDPIKFDSLNKKELLDLLEKIYALESTVIREDKPRKNDSHPDMKPVNLFGRLIKNSSKPGEIVLDPFGGSGTTVIACEQLGRKCRTVEFDPIYATVIIDRWEKLTGQKAERIE